MCASYEAKFSVTQLVEAFDRHGAPLVFPRGLPNIEPVDEVRPTDIAQAIRATDAPYFLIDLRFQQQLCGHHPFDLAQHLPIILSKPAMGALFQSAESEVGKMAGFIVADHELDSGSG